MKDFSKLDFENRYGSFYKYPFIGNGRIGEENMMDYYEKHLLSLDWETKRTARHEYFMSDKEIAYSYGGQTDIVYKAKTFTPEIRDLCFILNQIYENNFNACFLNKYDNELQHLSWHSDDFEGMNHEQPIAVVSFGAEREIWVKRKEEKGLVPPEQRILLQRGSLFMMPIGYQDTHFHRIPKHSQPCGWRISLTFRSFK